MLGSPTPVDRLYRSLTAPFGRVLRTSAVGGMSAAMLLIPAGLAATFSLTGSLPSVETWALIAVSGLLGGGLTAAAIGGAMLFVVTARLRGMVQTLDSLLSVIPDSEKLQGVMQGVQPLGFGGAASGLGPLVLAALVSIAVSMLLLPKRTHATHQPPHPFVV